MSEMNTETIHTIAAQFEVESPAAVVDADATLAAAIALRDSISLETGPDLTALTVKNLRKTHEAAVAWETRDARLRAADAIVNAAQQQLDQAKWISNEGLRKPLAALFNQRAEDFMSALEGMRGSTALTAGNGPAYAKLTAAANDLDMLRRARDAYSPRGSQASTIHDVFEKLSRVFNLTLDPNRDHLNFHNKQGLEFWATGVNLEHTITWQDRPTQEQNSADYIRSMRNSKATAATG